MLKKLPKSESLFDLDDGRTRFYIRYSKRHSRNSAFYGLRKVDLNLLEGRCGVLCFLWDDQSEPLFVPFAEFEEVFAALRPANDGQYKVQVYEQGKGTELYIANAGRFNVESYLGWSSLKSFVRKPTVVVPELNHCQVQTLLGGIGVAKGFDIWIPTVDRRKLDWRLTSSFECVKSLPASLVTIMTVVEEIDVIWLERGRNRPAALFEVEYTTPIYSGLLRLNDVRLLLPTDNMRLGIVSNDERKAVFVRQLNRPTFKASGLTEVCTFLEYANVYGWHERMRPREGLHA
ncbi:MAG: hypothetical protein ACREQW_25885 [Candidatus Binatia bacterium]